jgi:ABC-2 type transport system permease protein
MSEVVMSGAATFPSGPWIAPRRSPLAATVANLAVMSGRCTRLWRRNLDALITSLALPVMLMLVFVYLFGGAIRTGTAYVTYVVPGVILLCSGFSSAQAAVSVSVDMTGGMIDRLRSSDVSGSALIGGHVVASIVRNAASSVLVIGVALLIGFRPTAGALEWLAAVGILASFVLAWSWLSAAVGLLAKSPEAANAFTFVAMFLTYASSAFVPVLTMPKWIRGFAADQPITAVTETIRGLLVGTPIGTDAWRAMAWCAGILIVSVLLSRVVFGRKTS